jgi:hypothetical protein
MSDRDVDAEFAEIIARWDEVASLPEPVGADTEAAAEPTHGPRDPAPPDSAATDSAATDSGSAASDDRADLDDRAAPPGRPVTNPSPLRPSPTNPPPTRPFVVWRGAEQAPASDDTGTFDPLELLEDEDDHFVPGPTAPLPPQEDLSFWGIIAGLVGGPLLLLWLVLFRPDVSGWWTLGALGMTAGGFVLLVLRQPHSRDEDDPDNGARV